MDSKITRAICDVLAGEIDRVQWDAFTPEDWRLFKTVARAERVAPLVYWKLEQVLHENVSPELSIDQIPVTVSELRNDYYQSFAHNLALYSELANVLQNLRAYQIPVILLKGISLAATVYPDIALRPMGDIDLLVHRADLNTAIRAIEALHYKKLITIAPWYGQIAGYHCHLIKEANKDRVVEVHWNLIGNPRERLSPPVEWFWSQAVPWDVYVNYGVFQTQPEIWEVFTQFKPMILSPEACLLYLMAHLKIQHKTDGELLFWHYDIYQMITVLKNDLDWGLLIKSAGSFNWLEILRDSLVEIKEKFGTDLPEEANEIINTIDISSLGKLKNQPVTRIQKQLGRTANLPFWARVMILIAYVIPGRDYMIRHYQPKPAWVWPGYYLYRWIDILVESIRTIISMALKGYRR
jgi:hypothetical protein